MIRKEAGRVLRKFCNNLWLFWYVVEKESVTE
jgi:hypothetical protein